MREMKDSGVEWIGEIPDDWVLGKIGQFYTERNTKVSDTEYHPLSVTKKGIVPQLSTAAKTNDSENRKLIKQHDFVINSRSDRRGSCGISQYNGSCSLINIVLEPRSNMCSSYYNYVFKSDLFADEFYKWGNGIVDDLWSTKWSQMKKICVPYPPIPEQNAIADYLDSKCSQIDFIVEKTRQEIEKLKEYRQSMITEAVTKGLDPDVEMKDSGVEWIGEIPAHWRISEFGRVAEIKSNLVDPRKYPELHQISPDSIEKGTAKVLTEKTVAEAGVESPNHNFRAGQIIYSKVRPTLNKVTIAPFDGLCSADMYPIESSVNTRFLLYVMLSSAFVTQVGMITQDRVKMPKINRRELSSISITLPSEKEQEEIVTYLDCKLDEIDLVCSYKIALIHKLQQYKKSIIYECVTGKKEVPSYA